MSAQTSIKIRVGFDIHKEQNFIEVEKGNRELPRKVFLAYIEELRKKNIPISDDQTVNYYLLESEDFSEEGTKIDPLKSLCENGVGNNSIIKISLGGDMPDVA